MPSAAVPCGELEKYRARPCWMSVLEYPRSDSADSTSLTHAELLAVLPAACPVSSSYSVWVSPSSMALSPASAPSSSAAATDPYSWISVP